ncbi:S1 family peptidase [Viscerimonas tarda]
MIRKRLYVLAIFTMACVLNASTQVVLRENVSIVKPTYSPSSVKFIKDLSKTIRKNGYKTAADILDSYTGGGFGSGFIYTNPQTGKSYIITNRHVVSQADSVTVEFQYANKANTEFKSCPIAAVDEQVDLALIELPANADTPKGLKIRSDLPDEGAEVFSVGFPGLRGKPSWQLGQGIISNSAVFDKLLIGNSPIGAIQHTAQVDAGSSGGPLLVKTTTGEYEIIGVNTWKIKSRESANFSISGKSLTQFLEKYADNKKKNTAAELRARATEFEAALKKGYMEILPYISSEYISNVSVDHFYELVNAVPDSVSDQMASCFDNGLPIDGVRISLAYIMYKNIANNNLVYNSQGSVAGKHVDVIFTSDKKAFPTTWVFEQGEWRLQRLPDLKLTDLETKGVSKRYGYKNSLKVGMETALSESKIWGAHYRVTYEYTMWTFITGSLSLGSGTFSCNPKEGWADDEGKWESQNFYSFDIALGGQAPIKLSSVYFIPNLKFFIETNSNDVDSNLGYVGGIELAYKLKKSAYLLAGLSYKHRAFNTLDEQMFKDYNTLGVHVGITW